MELHVSGDCHILGEDHSFSLLSLSLSLSLYLCGIAGIILQSRASEKDFFELWEMTIRCAPIHTPTKYRPHLRCNLHKVAIATISERGELVRASDTSNQIVCTILAKIMTK